jgi:hypothetical protein
VNKELQVFCQKRFAEFKQHTIDCWGIAAPMFASVEKDLKSLHKQHFGLTTLCAMLSDGNDRGIYLASVPEVTELAIILTLKGLSNSSYVLMRQCIELALKHIFFSTHPVEFHWSQTREGYKEIGFQFLLDYLRKTDEYGENGVKWNLITDIEADFHRFSRYVHVQNASFMAFVQPTSSIAEISRQASSFALHGRALVSRLCFLLALFFRQEINRSQANEIALIKNAVYSPLDLPLKHFLAGISV